MRTRSDTPTKRNAHDTCCVPKPMQCNAGSVLGPCSNDAPRAMYMSMTSSTSTGATIVNTTSFCPCGWPPLLPPLLPPAALLPEPLPLLLRPPRPLGDPVLLPLLELLLLLSCALLPAVRPLLLLLPPGSPPTLNRCSMQRSGPSHTSSSLPSSVVVPLLLLLLLLLPLLPTCSAPLLLVLGAVSLLLFAVAAPAAAAGGAACAGWPPVEAPAIDTAVAARATAAAAALRLERLAWLWLGGWAPSVHMPPLLLVAAWLMAPGRVRLLCLDVHMVLWEMQSMCEHHRDEQVRCAAEMCPAACMVHASRMFGWGASGTAVTLPAP